MWIITQGHQNAHSSFEHRARRNPSYMVIDSAKRKGAAGLSIGRCKPSYTVVDSAKGKGAARSSIQIPVVDNLFVERFHLAGVVRKLVLARLAKRPIDSLLADLKTRSPLIKVSWFKNR